LKDPTLNKIAGSQRQQKQILGPIEDQNPSPQPNDPLVVKAKDDSEKLKRPVKVLLLPEMLWKQLMKWTLVLKSKKIQAKPILNPA